MLMRLNSTSDSSYGWFTIITATLLSVIVVGLEVNGTPGADLLAILLGVCSLVLFAVGWSMLGDGQISRQMSKAKKASRPVNLLKRERTALLERTC